MPDSRIDAPARPTTSPISLSEGAIRVRDEAAFGLGGAGLCSRFLARVFESPEVRSVTVDRIGRLATIRHDAEPAGIGDLLRALASALRSPVAPYPPRPLPAIPPCSTFSVHRYGPTLTTWEVVLDEPGRLRLRHEALKGDRVVADRIEARMLGVPGLRFVTPSFRTGHLQLRYDPAVISAGGLIRLAETLLAEPEPDSSDARATTPVRFGTANLCLGVAVTGEFLIPALLPVSAVLLVATNLRTFKAAFLQLERKRLGLPVLYLAIVATTLATGQFLASALMYWFFRFWHRQFRIELASEQGRLLEQGQRQPIMARLINPTGSETEVLVTVGRLKQGDRVIVAAGETVPADGPVLFGEGVVDERGVRGLDGISRKRVGDRLLAGSTVLAGAFHQEVERLGEQTRASAVRRALVAATSPAPGPTAPTIRSERFASKAVGPTLATAGVGLLAGDLMTVGAILRPDYATGPGLAVPLDTLRDVARCARLGIVARDPEALERLAECDLIVLGDHPILGRTELDVARIETRLPEPLLLRYAASAFRHLVDDRASALLAACRSRKLHVLNLPPVEFGRGVVVAHDKHKIRVMEADPAGGPAGTLAVEIDGTVVGLVEFAPTARPEAARAIERIRRLAHVPFALVSGRPEPEAAGLAGSLGVEMYRGSFSAEETAAFVVACRERGLKAAFVGDCRAHPAAAAGAHVAISIDAEADLDADPAGLVMQQARLAPLADLFEISRSHVSRVDQDQKLILVPNLICVAGAFLFGFTGLTAVMLSNLGTLGLYRRASDSLRELAPPEPVRSDRPRRAG